MEAALRQAKLEAKKAAQEAARNTNEALARAGKEAAAGAEQLLAAAKEREAALMAGISELRASLDAAGHEAAAKEESFRRQVGGQQGWVGLAVVAATLLCWSSGGCADDAGCRWRVWRLAATASLRHGMLHS